MTTRQLGRSELQVSPLCLGGNVFGWTIDEAASFRVLDAFVEAGFNFIDTADVYSRWVPGNKGGESEIIIGNWLKKRGKRDDVVIATKVGGEMRLPKKSLGKAYILEAVEDSLTRLKTDYIDLYQSHWDDPETPVEETLEAYDGLVKAGKVRVIGASNFTVARLKASLDASAKLGLPRYESLQPLYNLAERADFEAELAPFCRENGIGVISYFSLASGFLTGKYRSEADFGKSARGGGMGKYLNPRGLAILKALDEVAADYKAKPAEVAIAWLIARPGITAPIASATSLEQLADLAAAAKLQLSPAAIAVLDKASD